MTISADTIASLVLQHFDQLPVKRKPLVRDNGVHEWVPLSGIVAQAQDGKLTCISMATGMKCLPHAKLPKAQGNVLHDWHAEVLALRAFNRFVLDEAMCLAQGSIVSSSFLRRRQEDDDERPGLQQQQEQEQEQPFAWREDVKLHMYCSEAPCGDASMELTMASQDDASPWEIPPSLRPPSSSPSLVDSAAPSADPALPSDATITTTIQQGPLPGRSYFSQLGAVRLKPARGDAPPTLSKSCSDKLALKQCTSLLSSLTSLFVSPASVYLDSVILPTSQRCLTGCQRAFSSSSSLEGGGRMRAMPEIGATWPGGYRFGEFQVSTTDLDFKWSKRSVEARINSEKGKTAASNIAVAWTKHGLVETTLGGTLQGRKAFDIKGASFVSRRKMWALSLELAGMLGKGMSEIRNALKGPNYGAVKESSLFAARKQVKRDVAAHALKGWARNIGDDGFTL